MAESKDEIRKRILGLRNTLSAKELYEKSAFIFKRITDLGQYKEALTVLAYMDYKNEVMTREFIRTCLREGKKAVLPKVDVKEGVKSLTVYAINDLEKDTRIGYKGIIEPDNTVLKPLDPAGIDLAVIPGIAFDYRGNRIGYGAGYYDSFMSKLRKDCLKIGVAFNLQLVAQIPAEWFDIPVDLVATESMLLKKSLF